MKLSIIVPTYNESQGIVNFLKRLNQTLLALKKNHSSEIIIVDDNSPDGTGRVVRKKYKNQPKIRIFIRKNIRGLGTAIKYGIQRAKGEIVIGIDADGNHPPEKIPLLLKFLRKNDLVVASRFIKGGGVERKRDFFRHSVSFAVNLFFKILGFPVWDSTSGFYAIAREKLKGLGLEKIYYGYGDYHLRLVYLAKKKNLKIKEIPYKYQKRIAGRSKSRLPQMFFTYLIEGLRLSFHGEERNKC